MAFPPATRALLNPKFEGYKLEALDQSELVYQYHLPVPATQATVSGRSLLSFQEIADRIKHNHLAVSQNHRYAVYIDAQNGVNLVTVDEESLEPAFHRIFEIPEQINTDDTVDTAEYPSAVSLDAEHWIVSDGWGRLYVLRVSSNDASISGSVVAVAELTSAGLGPSSALVPCRLHNAALGSDGVILLVLSVKIVLQKEPAGLESRVEPSKLTRFDLVTGRMSLAGGDAVIQPVDVLWRRRGTHVPLSVTYDAPSDALLVIAGCQYWDTDKEPTLPAEPTPEDFAPIPRADENLESTVSARPPPYSWTQTEDSLTVAVPLPSSTSKTQIKVHFSPRTLNLAIHDPTGTLAEAAPVPLPHYSLEQFWDGISPSSSFWTWDSQADRTFGLLTLHLDKQYEGLKWPHIFARAANGGFEDVPETLDPSELWLIRESLEKYTAELGGAPGRGGVGLGSGRDMPSLADGEMDEDVDANVGIEVFVSIVPRSGTVAESRKTPVKLLSLPLPGVAMDEHSIVLKHDIDGTVYTRHGSSAQWEHVATFPAIAFVLASKRELRFVYHVASRVLLAFESGSSDVGGNLYLYRGSGPKDVWAVQAVLKIGGGQAGALLGVGAFQTAGGKMLLLCLCERQLAVVRDVL
ncbi:hypothetical protein EXIGLDRAFT_638342 [Exidia glandulosa HHB12029]|uniref:NudC domain-containing protein 1 n=1 Tax=Exidia glandulosa HHB12029 TaxID=1314781 RepID=A0A165P382_EXIGL|nr:hypothetical protein EXIGLDRAFT_638342 [Exidia glandulosa HHB12029]